MRNVPFFLAVVATFNLVACAQPQTEVGEAGAAPAPMVGVEYPKWVMGGSGISKEEGDQSFFGVGSASGIKNSALAMSTADNRARNEVGKIFEVYTASLMKDYMASTTAGDMSESSEEQHVEQAIKTFSANTLSGVVISDRWFHPDGTVYARAKLDLNQFTDALTKMKDLNAKVRDYVRENADRVHGDLDAEEEKRAGN